MKSQVRSIETTVLLELEWSVGILCVPAEREIFILVDSENVKSFKGDSF